jgi:hypothetical protein
VESQHLAKCFPELLASTRELVMQIARIHLPESCNIPDRQVFVKAKAQEFHAPDCLVSLLSGEFPLALGGFPKDGIDPGAVENMGEFGIAILDLIQIEITSNLNEAITIFSGFKSTGHVSHHAIEKRTKSTRARLIRPFQYAALPKTLHKNLLNRVFAIR